MALSSLVFGRLIDLRTVAGCKMDQFLVLVSGVLYFQRSRMFESYGVTGSQ